MPKATPPKEKTKVVQVTVIGAPRPILHPSVVEALQSLAKHAQAHERIGPSLADSMLALTRTDRRL